MSAKRALVVDDSKAARVFLARMLENYSIEVDSAESAEQAIEYLLHHRPPDVIFLDHLMPGMDGFEALAAIKNEPRTATIPVLMYTSQAGELYLGQARALGAVGVLPKQIEQMDVTKVLHQLHLLPERRKGERRASPSSNPPSPASPTPEGAASAGTRPVTDAVLREHFAEQRRSLVATLAAHASRQDAALQAALGQLGSQRPVTAPPQPRPVVWGWIIAAIAAIVAGETLLLAHRGAVQRAALETRVSQLQTQLAAAAAPSTSATASSPAAPERPAPAHTASHGARNPLVEVVPYGHAPLGGVRLDVLRRLFDRLTADGYHGQVNIKIFPGRFCLTGDAEGGYALAPAALPYSQCSHVGPDPGVATASAQSDPVAFADLLASFRTAVHGAVDVNVAQGDPSSTIVSYPPVTDALTAGDWNRAAGANNRVEIQVH